MDGCESVGGVRLLHEPPRTGWRGTRGTSRRSAAARGPRPGARRQRQSLPHAPRRVGGERPARRVAARPAGSGRPSVPISRSRPSRPRASTSTAAARRNASGVPGPLTPACRRAPAGRPPARRVRTASSSTAARTDPPVGQRPGASHEASARAARRGRRSATRGTELAPECTPAQSSRERRRAGHDRSLDADACTLDCVTRRPTGSRDRLVRREQPRRRGDARWTAATAPPSPRRPGRDRGNRRPCRHGGDVRDQDHAPPDAGRFRLHQSRAASGRRCARISSRWAAAISSGSRRTARYPP